MYYCFNGRYMSEGDLKNTGRSEVLKGVRRKDRRPVAIKVWEKNAPEGLREAEIWKKAFPNIFMESGVQGSNFVMVRSWIEGVDLGEYVNKNGRMNIGEAVSVCLCVAQALGRFYRLTGMYFGDLRSENIILGNKTVTFVDLESAGEEVSRGGTKISFKSKTLKFVTPGFAAPEVYAGRPCCASDFYAIGVLLRYMLNGGNEDEEHVNDERVRQFIGKCTEKRIEDRFTSIDALAGELKRILRETGEKPLGTLEDEVSFYLDGDDDREPEGGEEPDIFFGDPAVSTTVCDAPEESEPGEEEGKYDIRSLYDGTSRQFDAEKVPETFEPDRPLQEDPQDGAILFPHYEKGYRRLLIYVPANAGFSAELGFTFGACFGFKTCVYEFCDYAPPRLKYYLTAASPVVKSYEDIGGKDIEYGQEDGWYTSSIASEEGETYYQEESVSPADPGTSDDKDPMIIQYFRDDPDEEVELVTRRSLESPRVSVGAGSFEEMESAGDDFMRAFMEKAYSEYDVTIVCDNMLERREDSLQLMRYCDYILLPVRDEADEYEAAIAHYTRLLRENRISSARLKLVCWEKNLSGGGTVFVDTGKYEVTGCVDYDRNRQYLKNLKGDVYCRQMKGEILREYCDIAERLTYGERRCA